MKLDERTASLLDPSERDSSAVELDDQRTRLLDSGELDRSPVELDDQRTRLLGSSEHDSLDFADVEHDPYERGPLSKGIEGTRGGWMRRRWRDRNWRELMAVAMLVGVLCGALGYAIGAWARNRSSTSRRPDIASLRIMVAGDSISQGFESMHTWRYRLWEWFQANEVPVLFVGPFHRAATQAEDLTAGVPLPVARPYNENDIPDAVDDGYAPDVNPEFLRTGSAHFAIWGREIAQDLDITEQQIREYRPEYLLVELGFNDLAWAARKPDELLSLMKQFVDKARAVNPELRFAIANVPQRDKLGDLDVRTREYNEMLREAIPSWSLPASPVALVEFRETYSCDQTHCPATFDGIHPNNQGEFEIAHAFSKTLYQNFGIGKQPLAIPAEFPVRNCPTPDSIFAYPSQEYIRLTWGFAYGAYGYDVQARREGAEWETDSVNFSQARHLDTTWTTDGTKWEFRVRSWCESTVRSPWTSTISAAVV